MSPRKLACAVAVVCSWSVAVACQTGDAFNLPDSLRTHIKEERFGIVSSLRGLPLGVREALQTLFGAATLDIAEPGAAFQGSAASGASTLPTRRLIAAGCSDDNHCIVYYERAGGAPSWHVALFHWQPEATRFEWGGLAPRGLASIEDVRGAMLSGAIKRPGTVW